MDRHFLDQHISMFFFRRQYVHSDTGLFAPLYPVYAIINTAIQTSRYSMKTTKEERKRPYCEKWRKDDGFCHRFGFADNHIDDKNLGTTRATTLYRVCATLFVRLLRKVCCSRSHSSSFSPPLVRRRRLRRRFRASSRRRGG